MALFGKQPKMLTLKEGTKSKPSFWDQNSVILPRLQETYEIKVKGLAIMYALDAEREATVFLLPSLYSYTPPTSSSL